MERPEHPLTRPREGQPVKASVSIPRPRPHFLRLDAYWAMRPFPQSELTRASQMHFKAEANTLKWGHSIDAVQSRTRRWLIYAAAIAALLYTLLMLLVRAPQYTYDDPLGEATFYLVGILFAASVLDKFYFDFIGLIAGVDSLSKDFASGRWDLICITNTSMAELVRAKYVAAQLRAWRTMLVVTGLRVAVLTMIFMWMFVSPIVAPSNWSGDGIYGISFYSAEETMAFLGGVVMASIMAGVYVLEPRWRLRALAAGGLRASAHSRDTTSGLLRVGGTFLRLWVAQVGTVVVLNFGAGFAAGLAAVFSSFVIGAIAVSVAYTMLIAYAIRMIYVLFARRRLNETHSRLVRLGGAP